MNTTVEFLPPIPDSPEVPEDPSFVAAVESVVATIVSVYCPPPGSEVKSCGEASLPTMPDPLRFGIWGRRGQGKSSFLWLLHKRLSDLDLSGNDLSMPFLLPPTLNDREDSPPKFFEPADLGPMEDELQAVLQYVANIVRKYNSSGALKLEKLLLDEALGRDPEHWRSLTQFAEAAAINEEDLRERLSSLSRNVHSTNERIRNEISSILKGCRRPLLLVFDDIDLKSERCLPLVRLIYNVLSLPQVIIVVAADKTLLLENLTRALMREKQPPSPHERVCRTLAERQLEKVVPHSVFGMYSRSTPHFCQRCFRLHRYMLRHAQSMRYQMTNFSAASNRFKFGFSLGEAPSCLAT